MNSDHVRVVRLGEEGQVEQALPCMAEAPFPWPRALDASRSWMQRSLGTHARGLHLENADGRVIGHLYYAWSEQALLPYEIEEGVVVVLCEWVQRAYQGRGHARAMMDTLIRQISAHECKGIVVAASDDEQCMHFAHYQRRGFRKLDAGGQMCLMYRPLQQKSVSVTPMQPAIVRTNRRPVEIIVLHGAICPIEAVTCLAALEVACEFGNRVKLRLLEANRESLRELGVPGGAYVNGTRLPGGLTERAVRRAILKALGDE